MKEIGKIGDLYQAATKYYREPGGGKAGAGAEPRVGREIPLPVVELPPHGAQGGMPLWEALATRKTRRTYRTGHMTLGELSQLLWAGDGKSREGRGMFFRTAPSAGALYPVELYVMANRVDRLQKGVYRYDAGGNRLAMVGEGDRAEDAAEAALGQHMLLKAAAVVFMTAVVERSRQKYGQRAYRYIYLDAGHIGQNLCLAAHAMGFGACPIGAFYDDEMNAIIGVDGTDETVIYAVTIGK